jgi:dethiobiotin synthetase
VARGVFVTGTDTGAGKSVVAAAICAGLAAGGRRVAAFKPVVTGLDEPPGDWPPDHELLAGVTGQDTDAVSPWRFGAPASPHLAAELAGVTLEPSELLAAARRAGAWADALVCEGVGGLMVPITPGYLVRDLAVDMRMPVVVAARAGLGTINHTLLTLEAARAAGLAPVAVVMTPWPDAPSRLERSNRETVERLGAVPVAGLPPCTPATLADAAAALPLADWVAVADG